MKRNRTSEMCEHLNKPDNLPKVAQVAFFQRFVEINWDPTNFLKDLIVQIGPSPVSDDLRIFLLVKFMKHGQERQCYVDRSITMMTVIAGNPSQLAEAIRQETHMGAISLVDAILEDFGTTWNDEKTRLCKNVDEMVKSTQFLSPPQMVMVHPDKEAETRKLIAKFGDPSSPFQSPIQVVSNPHIPPGQAVMTNGTQQGTTLIKNIGTKKPKPAEEKKDTLQDAMSRRKRDAKWK